MSRARHKERKERADGGRLTSKPVWNAGGEQNAAKEAEERKRGGKVHHMHGEGEHGKMRHDRKHRARGGHVMHHHEEKEKERARGGGVHHDGHPKHHADGGAAHHKAMHAHTPGRKRGGGIGANRMPLSTAANIKEITKGEQKEDLGQH